MTKAIKASLLIAAALVFGAAAAGKTYKVDVYLVDPVTYYVTNADIQVTALDATGAPIDTFDAGSANGANPHWSFQVPGATDRVLLNVTDFDRNCSQQYDEALNGRPHAGGNGFFLYLDNCQ